MSRNHLNHLEAIYLKGNVTNSCNNTFAHFFHSLHLCSGDSRHFFSTIWKDFVCSLYYTVVCKWNSAVLLGMQLCYKAFRLQIDLALETGQTTRKMMVGRMREERGGGVSSSFSLLCSVLEATFLSSQSGGGHELCIGRV